MPARFRNAALSLGSLFLICVALTRAGVFVGLDRLGMPQGIVAWSEPFKLVVKLMTPPEALCCSLALAAAWMRRVGWRRALLVPAALIALVIVEVLCKKLVEQPAGSLTSTLPLGVKLRWSFPSGHEARACFLLAVLAARLPWSRMAYGAAACIATWLAGEMIMTGMHYTSDVLGGALLGGCAAALLLGGLQGVRGAASADGA